MNPNDPNDQKSPSTPEQRLDKRGKPIKPKAPREKTPDVGLDPIVRLNKDLRLAATTLSLGEVRYLVDSYYQIQEYRKASDNQVLSLVKSKEPHEVILWTARQNEALEGEIKKALDIWSDKQPLGQWARSIVGIGPVIAAGLMAYIDIKKAPTVGHIWRFAGLDPTLEWLGKEKAEKIVHTIRETYKEKVPGTDAMVIAARMANRRLEYFLDNAKNDAGEHTWKALASCLAKRPHSAGLKTLCWKIGQSFVKVSGNEKDFYGKLWLVRKEIEVAKNLNKDFEDQAIAKLARFKIGKSTDAYGYYSTGFLPPAHIQQRACRYAVKLFLSHFHAVAYRYEFGVNPPKPYVLEHLGHVHNIECPNWPWAKEDAEEKEKKDKEKK